LDFLQAVEKGFLGDAELHKLKTGEWLPRSFCFSRSLARLL